MIDIKNISYIYDSEGSHALRDVSLHIDRGEFVAIVGHNGSGKSTLAKHLNALLLPTEGNVIVDGMNTRDENFTLAIRQRVGMVFQNPDNQIVTTVVEEDVGFGPENLGVPTNEILRRVHDALEAVGMLEYRRSAPHMLSGGQKQRVAIAGTLAMEPDLLVLDEATAMLDPKGRRELLSIVRSLHKRGMTVVMITQYMEEAAFADRIVVMAGGETRASGTPKEIFAQPALLRSFGLDVPPVVDLRNRLRSDGVELSDDILTVEDMAEALCPLLLKS